MKAISLCSLMLISPWLFSGCSKHNSKPAKPQCHINSITGEGITYQITYNAAGLPISCVTEYDKAGTAGYKLNFEYDGNLVNAV